jgi:energy-coupling factor transporter ATP-binding protein EcfA2
VPEFALPHRHLTARVPWHDTVWDGRVCADPAGNLSCMILPGVADEKDPAAEQQVAGVPMADLDHDARPPCVTERAAWLSPDGLHRMRSHPYGRRNSPSHGHLLPTRLDLPAWTMATIPFRWMRRDNAPEIASRWGLDYRKDLEDEVDRLAGWQAGWVQDADNQRELLDAFFSAVRPGGGSLLFVYAKDIPLVERGDTEGAGRYIVAVTTVDSIGGVLPYDEAEGGGPVSSVMWERTIGHTLRPGATPGSWTGGVVLPYHHLLSDPDLVAEGLERFVAVAPADRHTEFSYAAEHLSHDGAVDALAEVARAVREAAPHAPGDWNAALRWLDEQTAKVWSARGAFPGIGSALTAAGVTNGTLAAHAIIEDLASTEDPWPVLLHAVAEAADGRGILADRGVAAGEAAVVAGLPDERARLLRMLSRMDLTPEQATRLYDAGQRRDAGIDLSDADLLANPWAAFEADRHNHDPVAYRVADRAVMVEPSVAAAHPFPADPPVEGPNDIRRVRAALADRLEHAAVDDGDTLLPQPLLTARTRDAYDPPVNATADLLVARGDDLAPVLVPASLFDGTQAWQLDRLSQTRELIAHQIGRRASAGCIPVEADWGALVDGVLPTPADADDEFEVQARAEKADALRKMATGRFTALVGPAGTGKTTLIDALQQIDEVAAGGILLLAPTGKAVVQLTSRTGLRARTIASLLSKSGRWDRRTGRYRPTGCDKHPLGETVVIDESSMVTEPMLAAVLDHLSGVKRVILAGDHRQLPPIGEGRPFADAVVLARDTDDGASLAELTVVRRQDGADRDDLRLAAWFASDAPTDMLDDTLWTRLSMGTTDDTVEMVPWQTPADLAELLGERIDRLAGEEADAPDCPPHDRLLASFGFIRKPNGYMDPADRDSAGQGAENWQILSPVRHRPGGVAPLNQLVQARWLDRWWPRRRNGFGVAKPGGPGRVTHGDKVIVTRNAVREAYVRADRTKERTLVANGEVGMVWGYLPGGRTRTGMRHVWLSTQPGRNYTVFDGDLEGENGPLIDAAYAITVHKSQGSQFGTVFLVIPDPCPLTSPELLYTALTRQTDRVVLLVQGGDPSRLRAAYGPTASETAARLTNLFVDPDPHVLVARDQVVDRNHVHAADTGVLVRSKSEVIVANALTAENIAWEYERPFVSPTDPTESLLPDFTIEDDTTGELVLWEHLGMMDRPDYRATWDYKVDWYRRNGVLPFDEGGGPNGTLVWSNELGGLRSDEVRAQARRVFG